MIVKEDFLKKLKGSFDLNIYEVKIWTALLSKGVSSAGELSDISEVPRSRSYDILESLEKKGFVVMKLGKPIKYIAVEPKEVIERVKRDFTLRAGEKVKMLEKVKDSNTYKELDLLHKHGIENIDPTSLSGAIKGRRNINDQLDTLFRNAKESILISTTAEGFLRKSEILKPLLNKLKNVKVKIMVPKDDKIKEFVKDLKNVSIKYGDINSRFVLVDSNELMFMVMDDSKVHESYDTGIWVKSPYFVKSLENLFNLSWKGL
ncbi:TrmB family transcriptional regulator [Candidatus Woesearchaeota archaeon]|nr:TrmB family transcriptional regulator [Candidatus Woesearchaeota archaeon]